jgi:hypothetical protein
VTAQPALFSSGLRAEVFVIVIYRRRLENLRVLAEQCREMAKHTVKPAVLLMRAQPFEASVAALERAESSDS